MKSIFLTPSALTKSDKHQGNTYIILIDHKDESNTFGLKQLIKYYSSSSLELYSCECGNPTIKAGGLKIHFRTKHT